MDQFVSEEAKFQSNNLSLLKKFPITETKALTNEPFGWVSQTTYDKKNNSLIFGYHRSGELAEIQKFDLKYKQIYNYHNTAIPKYNSSCFRCL